jgi:hypothetical protein
MDSGTAARRATESNRSAAHAWLPFLAVGALLGAAAVAAALSTLHFRQVPLPKDQEPTLAPQVAPTMPSAGAAGSSSAAMRGWAHLTLPAWLSTLITLLCVAVVAAVIAVLVWYLVRDFMPVRQPPPVVEPTEPDRLAAAGTQQVVAAVDAGLAGLSDTDVDPRRAIIGCWLRLEDAAAAAGTPREIGDTSTDLVLRLLAAHRVSRSVLAGFAAVYREARYSSGPVDEAMRGTAVAALRQVRAELSAEAAAQAAARAEAERLAAEGAAERVAAERAAATAAQQGESDHWLWGDR